MIKIKSKVALCKEEQLQLEAIAISTQRSLNDLTATYPFVDTSREGMGTVRSQLVPGTRKKRQLVEKTFFLSLFSFF